MGMDGVEKFVATPELQNENYIGADPLEPGQVWSISPGGMEEYPGLYRVETNVGPGSGVKILIRPTPQAFQESVRCAEQNLYANADSLVGIVSRGLTNSQSSFALSSSNKRRQVGVAYSYFM